MNSERIIVFSLLFVISYVTGSSAQSFSGISLSLRIRTPEKGILEPLRFRAIISNTEETDYYNLAPWPVRGDMLVEFRGPGVPDWKVLEVPYLNRGAADLSFGEPAPFILHAGESETADLTVLLDLDRPCRKKKPCYYFERYGEYTVRAKYSPAKDVMIFSDEASFRVVPYRGSDAAAYEWLRHRRIPHFVYVMSLVHQSSSHYTTGDATELIRRFPGSRFVPWAKIYLANCYRYGCCTDEEGRKLRDSDRAAELAQEVADFQDPGIRKQADEIFEYVNRMRPPEKHLKRSHSHVPLSDMNLSVSLRVRFDKIGLIDPLRFRVIFTNTGNKDLNHLVPWDDRRFISAEYRRPADREWKPLDVPYLSIHVKTHGIYHFSLKAGEAKTLDLTSLYDLNLSVRNKKVCYYFDRYGEYKIRVKYGQGKGNEIFSDEAAFQVIPYEGPDAAAYEWLRDKTVPIILYDMRRGPDRLGGLKDEYASELIERFPGSRFAAWTRVYLARCHMLGFMHTGKRDRVAESDRAAELVQGLANYEDPDIRRRTHYILKEAKRIRRHEKRVRKK